MSDKLWFFWGQEHLTFLRWVTLFSATQIHKNVVLVRRTEPIRPTVAWRERQDFQHEPSGHNWMENVAALPLEVVALESVAPKIAELRAPDIQTSDLLAWWLLAEHGGTVADMDIIFLKPLPGIDHEVEVVVFEGYPKPGYVPVTLMQGKPSSTWRRAFLNAVQRYRPHLYESCGSDSLSPKPDGRLGEHIIFPWAGKYGWSLWHRWFFESNYWPDIPDDCCGIHWYAGHNQKFNQEIKGPEYLVAGAVGWAVGQVLRGAKCPYAGANP